MGDSFWSTLSKAPVRTYKAVLNAPGHVLNFNPSGIVKDLTKIVSPETTPALKSESAGLGTAVNQGSKFIGNSPQEIRQAAR